MDFWVGLRPRNLVSLRAVLQGAGTATGLTPEPGWRQVGGGWMLSHGCPPVPPALARGCGKRMGASALPRPPSIHQLQDSWAVPRLHYLSLQS